MASTETYCKTAEVLKTTDLFALEHVLYRTCSLYKLFFKEYVLYRTCIVMKTKLFLCSRIMRVKCETGFSY